MLRFVRIYIIKVIKIIKWIGLIFLAFIYMVRCKDNSLYTGWTTNIERRVKEHNSGKGAKYTRARLPVKLVYYEKFKNKKEATKREYMIKKFSKLKKERFVKEFNISFFEKL